MRLQGLTSLAVVAIGLALLASAPAAARSEVSVSSNWAGYVVHRPGVKFGHLQARWTQGKAICPRARQTFSSVWVGLGGFYPSSRGLEQIGTGLDCTQAGRVTSSAWFEFLPAPARSIAMRIRPGDVIEAHVDIAGPGVTMQLTNRTTRQTFRRTFKPPRTDLSSAEWIVETPTGCSGFGDCKTLPLANFGTVTISSARAATLRGRAGAISSPAWDLTRVLLQTDVEPGGPRDTGAAAVTSPLLGAGTAFSVSYLPPGAALPLIRRRTFPASRRALR